MAHALHPDDAPAAREAIEREVTYLQTHRNRLDYGTARKKGEPLGTGPMESTCGQYQVCFKRTVQVCSQFGDEALTCLETLGRKDPWPLLFPHARFYDPSQN